MNDTAYMTVKDFFWWYRRMVRSGYSFKATIPHNGQQVTVLCVDPKDYNSANSFYVIGSFNGLPGAIFEVSGDAQVTIDLPGTPNPQPVEWSFSTHGTLSGEIYPVIGERAGTITVYARAEYTYKEPGGGRDWQSECQVNWSALGSVSPAVTMQYAAALGRAATMADWLYGWVLEVLVPFMVELDRERDAQWQAKKAAVEAGQPAPKDTAKRPTSYDATVGRKVWSSVHGRGVVVNAVKRHNYIEVQYEMENRLRKEYAWRDLTWIK